MSLRTKVEHLTRRDPTEHQARRLVLAIVLIPDDVRAAALTPSRTAPGSEQYAERVERECRQLFPALDAWGEKLRRDCDLSAPDLDDPMPDEVWNGPRLRDMPIPHAGSVVLQEARRAIRAHESGPAADALERDALAVCAYAGHLALNLTRSMRDLTAAAKRREGL